MFRQTLVRHRVVLAPTLTKEIQASILEVVQAAPEFKGPRPSQTAGQAETVTVNCFAALQSVQMGVLNNSNDDDDDDYDDDDNKNINIVIINNKLLCNSDRCEKAIHLYSSTFNFS